jgi:hypothetical protein
VLWDVWLNFEQLMVGVLPHVLASVLLLLTGLVLGGIVRRISHWLLVANQVDRRLSRLGIASALEVIGIRSAVAAVGRVLQWTIVFVAGMFSLYSLDARVASDLVERFLLYLPHLIVSVVVLAAGMLLSRFVGRSVLIAAANAEVPAARLLSVAARTVVMALAIAMAFEQLGIGRVTLLAAFAILFGGATLAVSIAVGIGTQDIVRRWVNEQFVPGEAARRREPVDFR